MKLPSIQLMDKSSQFFSLVGTAIHFVCLRQPQNWLGRYTANAVRLLYVANVVVGLFSSIAIALVSLYQEEKIDDFKKLSALVGGSMVPGGGFLVGYVVKETLFPDKKK